MWMFEVATVSSRCERGIGRLEVPATASPPPTVVMTLLGGDCDIPRAVWNESEKEEEMGEAPSTSRAAVTILARSDQRSSIYKKNARGEPGGNGIGCMSGEGLEEYASSCSGSRQSGICGEGTSSALPKAPPVFFRSCLSSLTILENGGRMKGSWCQQTRRSSWRPWLLKRVGGIAGRVFSSGHESR